MTHEATATPSGASRRTVLAAGGAIAAAGSVLGAVKPATAATPAGSPAAPAADRVVTFRDRQILIDGEPTVVMAGEIHYFRLKKEDWQSRLDRAKEAGLDTIATYIPWMWHETSDGDIDLTGTTRPERDLGAFLDLCRENGFMIIARPGPFTMGELEGEGVPERARQEHPEITSTGWDDRKATTPTVDYLAPAFLEEAKRWYDAVNPVIAERLHTKDKPGVIAYQLCNEIGMLAWVSNGPDLTDHLLGDFNAWLEKTYGDKLGSRYPFAGKAAEDRNPAIRKPEDAYAAALMHDLGTFMRGRFARYTAELKKYAEAGGVTGIPFLINIHGTGGNNALQYPIGVSQLMETFGGKPDIIPGSDFYLGSLDVKNVTDLYLINAFTTAVSGSEQPLSVLEFDAGHADYGNDNANQTDAESTWLKTSLCLAQGVKMFNYYLFTGGFNPKFDKPVGNGNDRIGHTGERHGFAAPVDPEGRRGVSFEPTKASARSVRALAPLLATMKPEHDPVTLGFVPDHYLTEYHPPQRESVDAVLADVQSIRGFGPRAALSRSLLFGGFRYDSIDLQATELDPAKRPLIALATGEYLGRKVQDRLVAYLKAGGKLLLSGLVPGKDMDGSEYTALRDALGLKPEKALTGAERFRLSVTAHGWADGIAEIRLDKTQLCTAERGTTVLREYTTKKGCGFDIPVGKGRAVVVTCNYRGDLEFWGKAMTALEAKPAIRHSATRPAVLLLTSKGENGRVMHAFNLTSGYGESFTVTEKGKPLFGGEKLHLAGRSSAVLPLGLEAGGMRIAYATAEIVGAKDGEVSFRTLGDEAVVAIDGPARAERAKVTSEGGRTVLRVRRGEFTVRKG
ncbi:beta-galactosidase [Streptomyces sp. SM10]|uniref:beta-galactosidase n=1 Tax=Streptomyces sp. SM10 TaxID=565556 RepID=UPI000CD4B9CB|nr:beta-galactosidase [Streptomyces sp. SM10]